MSDKPKFARAVALEVAREVCALLKPHCEPDRLIVAGSLRRRKEQVGDVELVYVSKLELAAADLFSVDSVPVVDRVLSGLLAAGTVGKRHTVTGAETWGPKNKLAFHIASGVPLDFFATTEAAWFNYLVCRTGGAANNTWIAGAALRKGWRWNPYGAGFTDRSGELVPVRSEREAFELVGLPYREPWERT